MEVHHGSTEEFDGDWDLAQDGISTGFSTVS